MSYVESLARPLIDNGLVTLQAIEGCSDADIAALLAAQGVDAIPESYRQFLSFGGKNPYWLTRTGEWDYEWLLEAKQTAREIVVDDHGLDFAPFEDAFIFQTHQGYMFYYFRADDLRAADPHFWIYSEQQPVQPNSQTFNEWLKELADYLPRAIELRRKMGIQ
ncbi:SMI1/KNR4 family protein [Nocardia sp. NPDC050712]|uniref:SMI1/KNR4 family protein n=1 Tax=Nocardia sp. NPDC050712 TaxID=3155518 RepID=UPI003407313D